MENTHTGSYLFLPTGHKEKDQGRGHTLKCQSAWGSLGKRFNLALHVCAHLSSFGPKELPHDGEVEASIVLSQKLGLAGGKQDPLLQTSCRGYDSKVTVLAICKFRSCVEKYK